jgi:hypothetical protein
MRTRVTHTQSQVISADEAIQGRLAVLRGDPTITSVLTDTKRQVCACVGLRLHAVVALALSHRSCIEGAYKNSYTLTHVQF